MNGNTPRKTAGSTQFDRFLETARKLECDEDKERFEAKMGTIVKSASPQPAVKKRRVK
jgi:hypothetical protein